MAEKKTIGIVAAAAALLAVIIASRSKASGGGAQGTLNLSVSPSGALVQIDGTSVTPGEIPMAVGTYTWTASKAGYITQNGTFSIASGLITDLAINLAVGSGGNQGSLTITPRDVNGYVLQAQIYIDGQFAGVGSITGQEPIGQHTVTASLSGYNTATEFVNVPTSGTTLTIVMTAVSAPPPTNMLTVMDESAVSSTSVGAPAFNAVSYTATVNNETNQSLTRTLTVYYKFVDSTGYVSPLSRLDYGVTITLAPGESFSFNMPEPRADGSGMDYIDIGVGVNACLYLIDENGNSSNGACTSGITAPPPGTLPPPSTSFQFKRYDMVIDRSQAVFVITNEGTDPSTGGYYTLRPWAQLSTGDPSQDFTLPKLSAEAIYSIWMHWGFNLVLTQTYHFVQAIANPMSSGIDPTKLAQLQAMLPADMTPNDVNNFFAPLYFRGTILDLLYFQITQNGLIV